MKHTKNIVPIELWGRDHWALLGYIETIMEAYHHFDIGCDAHMRQNAEHLQLMRQKNFSPLRPNMHKNLSSRARVMNSEFGSRLINGEFVLDHDDWDCIHDMIAYDFFTAKRIKPKDKLVFSDLGLKISSLLRQHKIQGGTFSQFTYKDN
jgi:hypothetical protein